jgi:pyridoxamine 5'-phosphate oxidase
MNPISRFNDWLRQATQHPAITEPTAMTLATARADGAPSARIVLLKAADENGFLFYTNYASRKSAELKENQRAALVLYWMPLDQQVRVEGRVVQASAEESDAYFASRPREKQVGAWVSLQSQPMVSRETFEAQLADFAESHEGKPIARPPFWGGWRVVPERIEFWQQRDARLHVRDLYTRKGDTWEHSLLYP